MAAAEARGQPVEQEPRHLARAEDDVGRVAYRLAQVLVLGAGEVAQLQHVAQHDHPPPRRQQRQHRSAARTEAPDAL